MRGWFQGRPLLSSILPAVGSNLWEHLAKPSYLKSGHLRKNLELASAHLSKPTLHIQRHLQAQEDCDQEDRKYFGWWEVDLLLPRLVVFDHHQPARCWGLPTWKVLHNPITLKRKLFEHKNKELVQKMSNTASYDARWRFGRPEEEGCQGDASNESQPSGGVHHKGAALVPVSVSIIIILERKVIIFVKRNSLILNLVTHCLKIQTSWGPLVAAQWRDPWAKKSSWSWLNVIYT